MSKEPVKRWLLGWMDVEFKQEESWENGQGGCSKVERTTTCVGVGTESEPGLCLIPTLGDEYASHFHRPHVASPFDHLTKKSHQSPSRAAINSVRND
jgi:hypothetical protein